MAIYIVKLNETARLIEAANKAQAINHVAKQLLTCEVATGHDIASLSAAGVKLETVIKGDK